jgi:4-alpha-glucanotransferase
MNVPGTPAGNWAFRALATEFAPAVAERMGELCEAYERVPADIRRTE